MLKIVVMITCALMLFGCESSEKPALQHNKRAKKKTTKIIPAATMLKTTKVTKVAKPKGKQCIQSPQRDSKFRSQADLMASLTGASHTERKKAMRAHQRRLKDSEKAGPDAYMLSVKDMDGDGKAERFYMWETLNATASGIQHLYLSNRGCWSYAGSFVSGPELGTYLSVLKEKQNGMPMIRTFSKSGCAGLAGSLDWYIWDKKAKKYQTKSIKTVQCSCPDDASAKDVKRHSACPS